MLPKKNRADKKAVEKIFKACPPNGREGKFVNSPSLTFKYLPPGQTCGKSHRSDLGEGSQISVIVPKSVAKLAVKRNLLRRLLYSILVKYIKDLPTTLMGVFVFKKTETDASILENEIKTIFNKIR